jgi:hypothetical protein
VLSLSPRLRYPWPRLNPLAQVAAEAEAEAAGAAGIPPAALVPFSTFVRWATAPHWASLEADEALARLANAQCDAAGVDPTHLLLQVGERERKKEIRVLLRGSTRQWEREWQRAEERGASQRCVLQWV